MSHDAAPSTPSLTPVPPQSLPSSRPLVLPSVTPTLMLAPGTAWEDLPPAGSKNKASASTTVNTSHTLKLSPGELEARVGPPDLPPPPPPPAMPWPAAAPSEVTPSAPPSAITVPPSARPWAMSGRRRILTLVAIGVASLALGALAVARSAVTPGHRWVAPTLLSSADPRVVEVAATLQEETSKRSALLLQKNELESRLNEARQWVVLEAGFQTSFKAALRSDLEGQRAELRHLQSLMDERDWSLEPLPSDGRDLDAKLATVRQRIRLLEAAAPGGQTSSYAALALRREYDRSLIASEQARVLSVALEKAIADVGEAIRQKDALLATIDASPYRRAIAGDVPLAFIPYDNDGQVRPGDELLACQAAGLDCHPVGRVGELLPTEVHGSGPGGDDLRGRLAVLTLTEPRAVERPFLIARASTR